MFLAASSIATVSLAGAPSASGAENAEVAGALASRGTRSVLDYVRVGETNQTSYLQSLVNDAAAGLGRATIQPGIFPVENLVLPPFVTLEGEGGGTSRYGGPGNRRGSVVLQRVDDAHRGSIVTIEGAGASLKNITINGLPGSGARTRADPALVIRGAESTLDAVRVIEALGGAIDIQGGADARWRDVFVDRSGADGVAAVRIRSVVGSSRSARTRNLDIDRLTIEQPRWVGLDIAYGNSTGDYAEQINITRLHTELNSDMVASVPMVRVGNVWHLSLLEPISNYGPGPWIEVNAMGAPGADRNSYTGRVTVVGGTIIGATPTPEWSTQHLVRLISGRQISFIGTRFERVRAEPVRIEASFAGKLTVDEACSVVDSTDNPFFFKDLRTISGSQPRWMTGEGLPPLVAPVGGFTFPEHFISSGTVSLALPNVLQAVPFVLRAGTVIDAIGYEVISQAVGGDAHVTLGLWRDSPEGNGPLLSEGVIGRTPGSPVTSAGAKTDALVKAVRLEPGRYWAGLLYSYSSAPTGPPVFRSILAARSLSSASNAWDAAVGIRSVRGGSLSSFPSDGVLQPDTAPPVLLALRRSA